MVDTNTKKHIWLYVLKLEQGKYYVGRTSQKDPETRIQQHKNKFYTAQWVRKYPYLETLEKRDLGLISEDEAKKLESNLTLNYMDKYGKDNVKGGDFNYSGKYFYRFGRVVRDKDWETITVIVFLLLIILVLAFKYIFK